MKYFKVKPEYDNKPRSDGSILVANELYTEHEVQKFKIPENRLSVIEVSPSNTIVFFGARFQTNSTPYE